MKREIGVRERLRREKYVRNIVDLRGCLLQKKGKRNREERSIVYFEKYYNAPTSYNISNQINLILLFKFI